MGSNPFQIQIRGFATEARAKTSEAPRGPLGNLLSFLPRWGSPYFFNRCWDRRGFWKKLGFYFVVILIVNGLITVGYYTMDDCYGVVQNKNGKWQLISDCHAHHHQFELILNFPGGLRTALLLHSAGLRAGPRAAASPRLVDLHRDHACAQRSLRIVERHSSQSLQPKSRHVRRRVRHREETRRDFP